jgi:branched-chain amino acid transport system ATP-binding protein
MTSPALQARGLRKSYGALVVTENVDLSLDPGCRHALIGPNGAGKTTLVGLLSGAIQPDAGSIALAGEDITGVAAHRRVKRGLVRTFQVSSLFRNFSVVENLYLAVSEHAGTTSSLFRAAGRQRLLLEGVEALIERMGLQEEAYRQVATIAYGKQRLLELAIALALEPKVLLLDEPAAGIPAAEAGLILEAIASLPADIAILMIEHDMQMVRRFATEVSVLVNGRLLMTGKPQEVMSSDEVRAVYLGRASREHAAPEPSRS